MGKRSKRGGGQVKATPAPIPSPVPSASPRPMRSILPTPMTRDEYVDLAKEISRKEIMVVAQALGKQVYDMVASGVDLGPVVERIDACLAEQVRFNVVLNAIAEILIEKDVIGREELSAKADAIADAAVKDTHERHRTQAAKLRQAREAQAKEQAGGAPPAEAEADAPELEPEAE